MLFQRKKSFHDHLVFEGYNLKWRNKRNTACVLVVPLAAMTPVLLAYLFYSREKIVVDGYTFQSTILQQQFWNQSSKLNYQASDTQCDYSQWQCWRDRKTSSNKIWIVFYDLVNISCFLIDNINSTRACIVYFDYIWAAYRSLCSRAFSLSHHVSRSIHSFNICC